MRLPSRKGWLVSATVLFSVLSLALIPSSATAQSSGVALPFATTSVSGTYSISYQESVNVDSNGNQISDSAQFIGTGSFNFVFTNLTAVGGGVTIPCTGICGYINGSGSISGTSSWDNSETYPYGDPPYTCTGQGAYPIYEKFDLAGGSNTTGVFLEFNDVIDNSNATLPNIQCSNGSTAAGDPGEAWDSVGSFSNGTSDAAEVELVQGFARQYYVSTYYYGSWTATLTFTSVTQASTSAAFTPPSTTSTTSRTTTTTTKSAIATTSTPAPPTQSKSTENAVVPTPSLNQQDESEYSYLLSKYGQPLWQSTSTVYDCLEQAAGELSNTCEENGYEFTFGVSSSGLGQDISIEAGFELVKDATLSYFGSAWTVPFEIVKIGGSFYFTGTRFWEISQLLQNPQSAEGTNTIGPLTVSVQPTANTLFNQQAMINQGIQADIANWVSTHQDSLQFVQVGFDTSTSQIDSITPMQTSAVDLDCTPSASCTPSITATVPSLHSVFALAIALPENLTGSLTTSPSVAASSSFAQSSNSGDEALGFVVVAGTVTVVALAAGLAFRRMRIPRPGQSLPSTTPHSGTSHKRTYAGVAVAIVLAVGVGFAAVSMMQPSAPNQIGAAPATTTSAASTARPGPSGASTASSSSSSISTGATTSSTIATTTITSAKASSVASTITNTLTGTWTVMSQGQNEVLKGTYCFDFDTGVESSLGQSCSGSGMDVFWDQVTATIRQIVPINNASITNLGTVNFAEVNATYLRGLNYSTNPIDGNNDTSNLLVQGDVFAVCTTSGNYAKVQVTTYGYDLVIQWLTYSRSGSTSSTSIIASTAPTTTTAAPPATAIATPNLRGGSNLETSRSLFQTRPFDASS